MTPKLNRSATERASPSAPPIAEVVTSTAVLSSNEADRSIYIDFETLGNAPEQPAILGILGASGPTDIQIFVLDPILASASRAKKTVCQPVCVEDAVKTIVGRAEVERRRIVSWSTFDREVVRLTCSPALVSRFDAVYCNALDTARRWKRTLYPNHLFSLDPFGGKHPLKQYFQMIGYEVPARLSPATPAKWLRRVLERMRAVDGRYGAISELARRDWRRLLEYNEHDCRGMREVVSRAAREVELWRAYERTHFNVHISGEELSIRVGAHNPKLDVELERLNATRWAYLTASNPDSRQLSIEENMVRNAELAGLVRDRGNEVLAGYGRDATAQWPPEASVLVVGISRREARELGRRFGQLAIVAGHKGYPARLLPTGLRPNRPVSTQP